MSQERREQRGAVAGTVAPMQHTLVDALTIASRLARRYGASTLSPSGNRVWVIPSRVSWLDGAYFVEVTSDEPDFTPRPEFPREQHGSMELLTVRLVRGGLSTATLIWTPECLEEPPSREEPAHPPAPEVPVVRFEAVTIPLAETSS